MIHLKLTFRSILRQKLNTGVIILSLGMGLACINLIALFINKELNADSFQKNRKQIYALQADDLFNKGRKMYYISKGAGEYMKNNYPEVKDFCRIWNANPKKVIVGNQDYFDNSKVIAATANFFAFFSYPLISNSPEKVLATKQDIVISQELAFKYFGTADPVGQKIVLVNRDNQDEMIVSGVFNKVEESTLLNFDMVRLIGEYDANCFLLLAEHTDIHQLEESFSKNRASIPIVTDGPIGTHYLKNIKAAYFDTTRKSTIDNYRDKTDLIIAMVMALMVMAVALFNYIGLINNRLVEKTREHSIRRINGSSNTNLINDFMLEVTILVMVAFILSMALMIEVMPLFNQLSSSFISSSYIFNPQNILLLFGIPLLILVTTSVFASIRIGKKLRIETLKSGKFQSVGKTYVPVFNIAQLAISVILIIGSIVIVKQINYITNKKIGIDKQVLEIKIPQNHKDIASIFKTDLEKQPSIQVVSMAEASPVLEHYKLLLYYNDNGTQKRYIPSLFVGDQNYIKALGIKIVAGEDFSEDAGSNNGKCIINESLAKIFEDQNLIGKGLPGSQEKKVIGIAKDFHYSNLKDFVGPACITYGNSGYYLMAKPLAGQENQAKEIISRIWDQLITDYPLNMESINNRYEWMHRENSNYAKLIGACCIISVFLSMIGLFAVSFQTSRRRIKEIGIRKVNGAKIMEILALLNKDFIAWVIVAFIISIPIAWYVMNKWLESFIYKTELSWWIFILSGIIALGIALLTVSWQSWWAATRNPVEALRYE